MQKEIKDKVLDTLNFPMGKERRNNATVHPTSLTDMYSNIKIVFPSKEYNVTGIIQNFKTKYRKKLMRYVIACKNDDLFASEMTFFKLSHGWQMLGRRLA